MIEVPFLDQVKNAAAKGRARAVYAVDLHGYTTQSYKLTVLPPYRHNPHPYPPHPPYTPHNPRLPYILPLLLLLVLLLLLLVSTFATCGPRKVPSKLPTGPRRRLKRKLEIALVAGGRRGQRGLFAVLCWRKRLSNH
ncbi:hypothetical protein DFP73DRAFT_529708 [Morchella snyderi]|nr:hypothetical protein DFP73DRAFT_529708 [Morchella snyderi]